MATRRVASVSGGGTTPSPNPPTSGGSRSKRPPTPAIQKAAAALPLAAIITHLFLCPFTKVEESFAMQATHDLLYERNLSNFDHLAYPGVVPRTFLGPLSLAAVAYPVVLVLNMAYTGCTRIPALYVIRGVLGVAHYIGLRAVGTQVAAVLGVGAESLFYLITASQFHEMFYASRTLPNTFALNIFLVGLARILEAETKGTKDAVRLRQRGLQYLAFACLAFRCDLLVLIAPLVLVLLATRRIPFWHTLLIGVVTGAATIAISVALDSPLWKRPLWPEGEVLFYNTVENKSSNWGTSPWWWYFTSALPRALLGAYVLVPVAVFKVKPLRFLTLPTLAFVAAYSFLPHKELRFIFYALPVLNIAVAGLMAQSWQGASTHRVRRLALKAIYGGLIVGSFAATGLLATASYSNYPTGYILHRLHQERPEGGTVHIDTEASMAGLTRFQKNYCVKEAGEAEAPRLWSYSKVPHEVATPDGQPYEYHITYAPANYTVRGYKVILEEEGFVGLDKQRLLQLDWWPLPFLYNSTAYVVELKAGVADHYQRIISGIDIGA